MSEPRWIDSPSIGTGYLLREGVSHEEPLVVMLHGWSGDERVMWIFETVLPEGWWIASPRGMYPLEDGGYNWLSGRAGNRHTLSEFEDAVVVVDSIVEEICKSYALLEPRLVLMGFSQGAALAFSVAELSASSPSALVSLAGFLPEGDLKQLMKFPIFWGHGLHDSKVPIELAREGIHRLQKAEAEIHYCEADVGHKVGVECARGLKSWLNSIV